ncbi:glycosyltransferase family 4 protein [Lachnospiraceae bacterium JLR.KK008]
MKKVLIVINFDEGLYNFRKELLEKLVASGHEVHVAVPTGEYTERLQAMGCIFHNTALNRRGTNPLQEISLLRAYRKILRQVQPDVTLTYTIKPNVYMGFLCGLMKIPYVTTITGLGTAVEGSGLLQRLTQLMYRVALRRARLVFFQNETNEKLFARWKIAPGRHKMLPGSGVNLQHFARQPFPEDSETVGFLFISRIMKEKGIEQLLDAAQEIRGRHPETRFRILGFLEEDYTGKERFERLQREGVIEFIGSVEDVIPYIRQSQCILHPSYYPEGMSNVCLEAAACGRAVITTDRAGCRETVLDGKSGFLIREKDSQDLIDKTERFLALSVEERKRLGENGRQYMEQRFDRNLVVERYLKAVERITNKRLGGNNE